MYDPEATKPSGEETGGDKLAFEGLQKHRLDSGRSLKETVILKPEEEVSAETEKIQQEIQQTKAELQRIQESMQELVTEHNIDLTQALNPETLSARYGDAGREFNQLMIENNHQKKKLEQLKKQLTNVEIDPANYNR